MTIETIDVDWITGGNRIRSIVFYL